MAAFEESWGVSGRDNHYAIPNVSLEWHCRLWWLQVVAELPYEDVNCFVIGEAVVVPMRTFPSQLP
jgi:hypothetical protein